MISLGRCFRPVLSEIAESCCSDILLDRIRFPAGDKRTRKINLGYLRVVCLFALALVPDVTLVFRKWIWLPSSSFSETYVCCSFYECRANTHSIKLARRQNSRPNKRIAAMNKAVEDFKAYVTITLQTQCLIACSLPVYEEHISSFRGPEQPKRLQAFEVYVALKACVYSLTATTAIFAATWRLTFPTGASITSSLVNTTQRAPRRLRLKLKKAE